MHRANVGLGPFLYFSRAHSHLIIPIVVNLAGWCTGLYRWCHKTCCFFTVSAVARQSSESASAVSRRAVEHHCAVHRQPGEHMPSEELGKRPRSTSAQWNPGMCLPLLAARHASLVEKRRRWDEGVEQNFRSGALVGLAAMGGGCKGKSSQGRSPWCFLAVLFLAVPASHPGPATRSLTYEWLCCCRKVSWRSWRKPASLCRYCICTNCTTLLAPAACTVLQQQCFFMPQAQGTSG